MPFLSKSASTTVVDIKLTAKGRELLASGEDFKITQFAFGDTEMNYLIPLNDAGEETGYTARTQTNILGALYADQPIKNKLYVSGVVPTGTPQVIISSDEVSIPLNGSKDISAYSLWSPATDVYDEAYRWTNLGPMEDRFMKFGTSNQSKVLTITAKRKTGSTTLKVEGQTTGAYKLIAIDFGSE